jgi:hypothetical protein
MNILLNDANALREAWNALLVSHPHTHGPQAAAMLGVPEAAMVASRQGFGATALNASLAELLCHKAVPVSAWGKTLVAVRNGLGVSLAVQKIESARADCDAVELAGTGYLARLGQQGIASMYLLINEDSHGHTVSLNWFDGKGDVIGRLFLMAKSGREVALPHLLQFAVATPTNDAFWRAEATASPASMACTDVAVLHGEAFGHQASALMSRAVLACATAGDMHVGVHGLGASQHYVGPLGKTSEAGGGVHASDAGCKLHLMPRAASGVSRCVWTTPDGQALPGLRVVDAAGGALDLAPVNHGQKWLDEVFS